MPNYKTAITRGKLSSPTKYLLPNFRGKILDFGCGKGEDADLLSEMGYKVNRYDPYYFPKLPKGKYDTIYCNYVLNIVDKKEQSEILEQLDILLAPKGIVYISVRADVKGIRKTCHGIQRQVKCPIKSGYKPLHRTGWYAVYTRVKS